MDVFDICKNHILQPEYLRFFVIFKLQVTFLLFIVFYQTFEYAEKILNTLKVAEDFLTTTDRKALDMFLFLGTALRGKQ